ncbi:MAG: hypothetical protein JSU74_04860 [Candidatus Zixiibacteriota bacterium]|nr:MAG: hypothetical protein JSU74_04860 [candidate division Zixibacteria bacterium]
MFGRLRRFAIDYMSAVAFTIICAYGLYKILEILEGTRFEPDFGTDLYVIPLGVVALCAGSAIGLILVDLVLEKSHRWLPVKAVMALVGCIGPVTVSLLLMDYDSLLGIAVACVLTPLFAVAGFHIGALLVARSGSASSG